MDMTIKNKLYYEREDLNYGWEKIQNFHNFKSLMFDC